MRTKESVKLSLRKKRFVINENHDITLIEDEHTWNRLSNLVINCIKTERLHGTQLKKLNPSMSVLKDLDDNNIVEKNIPHDWVIFMSPKNEGFIFTKNGYETICEELKPDFKELTLQRKSLSKKIKSYKELLRK